MKLTTHKTNKPSIVFKAGFFLVLILPLVLGLQQCSPLDLLLSSRITETVSGDWIIVKFTSPHYPDDRVNHYGGLDVDLVALIESAQERIDVAAYCLDLHSVAEALIEASNAGVRVRLVTDGSNLDEEAVALLQQNGIPVVARPEGGWGIMHNKFIVVDGMWVWTGSWNLTENGTYRNNNNAVLVASRTLAESYGTEFEELFSREFGPSSPADTPYPLVTIQEQETTAEAEVEVYFAPEDDVAERLLTLLSSAEDTVRFMAFQFTSPQISDALIDLAREGIFVQGVVEARSADGPYSEYDYLRVNGVDVWQDGNPYIMHHKVLIIDEQTVVLGSYNFSGNAEENNDENVLVIHDPEVASAFLSEFGRVLQEAQTADQ